MLMAKRLERGLTIEDVASATNLRTFFLTCMEEGRFDQLPGGIYTDGLARLYMSWLGFDEQQCQEWLTQIQLKPKEDEKKLFITEKPITKISLPVWISLCVVTLIVILLTTSSKDSTPKSTTDFTPGEKIADGSFVDKAATLSLFARGTTWIKITDEEHRVVHTQLAKKGENVDLTPYMGKKLTVGDGRQLVIYHNGEEIGALAEPSTDSTPVLVEDTPIQIEP